MKNALRHLQSWCGCYCILLLILVIVILLGTRNTTPTRHPIQYSRYQIAGNSTPTCWVLDTYTSQLWMRTTRGGHDLGTNSKPYKMYDRELKLTESSVWDEAQKLP